MQEDILAVVTQQEAAEWLRQYGDLPRAERSTDGKWTLYDTHSNEVIGTAANAEDAARMAATHARLTEDQHADRIAQITTAYQAAEATGQWAAESGRSQKTELDLSRRLTVEEARHESDTARNRSASQERLKGGDGSATRLVFGQSTTETEHGLRRTTNRILAGGSILTVFHEDAHALRREAHARGILSREDDIAIIRAVDAVLNGKTVRRRKGAADMDASPARLSLLPENFDSLSRADQDVAIDEAISELMEAEIIRTRKGGGARDIPAGIISRNMAAIARLAGPQAAGRFGSFMEAFRSFFGLATDRAHHIKRGLADGSISQADYDGYFRKLSGKDTAPNGKGRPDDSPFSAAKGSTDTVTAAATTAGAPSVTEEISFALSPESATARKFRDDVDAILAGSYDMTRPVTMGVTPNVLRAAGANQLLLSMPPSVVIKAIGGKHDLSPELFKEVITSLHNPIFVFESETVPDALTVILDLKHQGDNLLVAVHLDQKRQQHKVNNVASVYAKTNPQALAQWMKDGKLRYIHTQKGRDLFRSRGLQLPKEGTPHGNRTLVTEADIVKNGGNTSFSLGPAPSVIRPLDSHTNPQQDIHDERLREPLQILEALRAEKQDHGEGSLRPNAGKRRKHGKEFSGDSGLMAWAERNGRALDPAPVQLLADEDAPGGGEHKVLYDEESQRVVKLTKPGFFGTQAEDALAYLERWALHNRAFGDDVAFEGLVTLPGEHAPRAVISQRYAEGRDATPQEQADFLNSKGFYEQPDGRWIHPIRGITVWDTITPGNVIATEDGMRVIDLQMAPTSSKELAEVRQQTGMGRETSFSIGNDPDQPHNQQHDEEGRMVSGTGGEPEVPGGTPEEIGRRIREALARRERADSEEHVGNGSESFVLPFGGTEVLKEIKSSGIIRFGKNLQPTLDFSAEAVDEKIHVIHALGGMKTRMMRWEDKILIIQDRGTPISEAEYLSIELPFGIEPSRQGVYKVEINGEDYLISDLKPDNFVKDSQGNIRLIDLITGKVDKGAAPR